MPAQTMTQRSWEHLIKPYRINFEKENSAERSGTITVEPLEKGFGHTLGNVLRRVMLSSLRGAAVTAIKIQHTLLEFSSIPGVLEDVTEIVLNIKALELRLLGDYEEPKKFLIEARGPGKVTAESIQCQGMLEVLDPHHVICTLNDNIDFVMELFVSKGKGYVPYANTGTSQQQAGEIGLDARFTPVRKVSYTVEQTRVGQFRDYDSLVLNIVTNGALSPQDAVNEAIATLQDQLKHFVHFDPEMLSSQKNTEEMNHKSDNIPFSTVLLKNVKDLDLSVRCLNCLQSEGIIYVGDLVNTTEARLLRTPNFGRKSLNDINDALGRLGLSLGMNIQEWPPENLDDYTKESNDI